eukprot:6538150-Pyramimonas_sp.AAC.1
MASCAWPNMSRNLVTSAACSPMSLLATLARRAVPSVGVGFGAGPPPPVPPPPGWPGGPLPL